MSRIEINEKNCCGCAACANVCAHGAIKMKENDRGFLMPVIDDDKCVDCGLCSKTCDFKRDKPADNNIGRAYSLVCNNKEILLKSTSGGAFSIISDYVLEHGGMVVGSVMERDFTIHHVITSDAEIRDRMRGSKYVQSDISDIYSQIRSALQEGKLVLFTGAPCQCGAVKSFFKDKFPNLLIVDFLCHGVPSNKMFKEHVAYLDRHYGSNTITYSFRDKKYGWNSYNNNNNTADGKFHSKWINQIYYNFFVSNLSLRDSCYNCTYRSLHRPSDITIADFWGIEKLTGKKNHEGVSLVLTHTDAGELIMRYAETVACVKEYPVNKIAYRIALHPSKPHKSSQRFWNVYAEEGYDAVAKTFFQDTFFKRMRYEIRKIAKRLKLN